MQSNTGLSTLQTYKLRIWNIWWYETKEGRFNPFFFLA